MTLFNCRLSGDTVSSAEGPDFLLHRCNSHGSLYTDCSTQKPMIGSRWQPRPEHGSAGDISITLTLPIFSTLVSALWQACWTFSNPQQEGVSTGNLSNSKAYTWNFRKNQHKMYLYLSLIYIVPDAAVLSWWFSEFVCYFSGLDHSLDINSSLCPQKITTIEFIYWQPQLYYVWIPIQVLELGQRCTF